VKQWQCVRRSIFFSTILRRAVVSNTQTTKVARCLETFTLCKTTRQIILYHSNYCDLRWSYIVKIVGLRLEIFGKCSQPRFNRHITEYGKWSAMTGIAQSIS